MQTLIQAEFLGTPVSILDHLGRRWLTARDVGRCLGYAEEHARHAILKLYSRHADEFGEEDQGVVNLTTPSGGEQQTRIFSQTGCILLAMFANTARAKDFRAWAKRVLSGMTLPEPPPQGYSAGYPRITRTVERQVLEMFLAGLSMGQIERHFRINKGAISKIIHGQYRFSPGAGENQVTPELAQAVARELARREQERIAERFCASLANQTLVAALEQQGQRILKALAAVEG